MAQMGRLVCRRGENRPGAEQSRAPPGAGVGGGGWPQEHWRKRSRDGSWPRPSGATGGASATAPRTFTQEPRPRLQRTCRRAKEQLLNKCPGVCSGQVILLNFHYSQKRVWVREVSVLSCVYSARPPCGDIRVHTTAETATQPQPTTELLGLSLDWGASDPPPRFLSCPQLHRPASSSRNLPRLRVHLGVKLGGEALHRTSPTPRTSTPSPPPAAARESISRVTEWQQNRSRGRDGETGPVWEGGAGRPACLKSGGAPGPSL